MGGLTFGYVQIIVIFCIAGAFIEHLLGNETGILAYGQFNLIGEVRIFLQEQFRIVPALTEAL